MKHQIKSLVSQSIQALQQAGTLDNHIEPNIKIEHARDKKHGDYACNIAMILAKQAKKNPRELAEEIINHLPVSSLVEKTEIAGPGFINFYMSTNAFHSVVTDALDQKQAFGRSDIGKGKQIQVEFVSANPTGPLHVGHGRGAAYGATVSNLLEAAGYNVHREYYVNDAGRQMDILGTSVWLRYLDLCGETIVFPKNGYQGDYIWDFAANLHRENGDKFRHPSDKVFNAVPADEGEDGGDKEAHIDGLIKNARALLGEQDYNTVFEEGLNRILDDIRQDLEEFGVTYDDWFSERKLFTNGSVDKAIKRLQDAGHAYEQNGATWFRSSDFGDEKDRVLVRENGIKTYFASDIAYHMDKLERGYDRVIDVWGADHHGYVPRVKAALKAIGDDPDKLDVLLVQFAVLYRNGEKVQMSTRSGEFVTLRELRDEVGNDAARFFYVMHKCEQHMDFDLDLAKSRSNDNPVYYVQYAHARICSVWRQMQEKGFAFDETAGRNALDKLVEQHEQDLMNNLSRYPEVVESAAINHEPHQIAYYLRDLANHLHTYYNALQFLVDDADVRNARLVLISAVRQTLQNGLELLGVSAPESM